MVEPAATNIDLNEGQEARAGRASHANALLLRTPAALMPQLDRGVGADLVSTRGDVVGKRDDFKVWPASAREDDVPTRG